MLLGEQVKPRFNFTAFDLIFPETWPQVDLWCTCFLVDLFMFIAFLTGSCFPQTLPLFLQQQQVKNEFSL